MIKLDMARHCKQWKGTSQDCVDHIRLSHAVPHTVKAANLGKWFPQWAVSRETWREALNSHVSGVSTDVILLSENGAPLIHHYRVFGRGMLKLRAFTVQAEAEARWERNRTLARSSSLLVGSDHQHGVRQREPDDDSPCCKTRRAMSPIVRRRCPLSIRPPRLSHHQYLTRTCTGWPPLRPVTLRMPNFADKDFIPSASQSLLRRIQHLRHLALRRSIWIWTLFPSGILCRAIMFFVLFRCRW